MASKIEVLRAVAAAVGVEPPVDENENTAFLLQILPLYTEVVDDFASRHAWQWGVETRTITASTDDAPPPWLKSYPLPVDRTLIRELTDVGGLPLSYEIRGQRILCDHDGPLQLQINVATTPDYWPAYFTKCVRITLEGYAWKGLRDDYTRGQKLIEDVDPPKGTGHLHRAIAIDKRQQPPRRRARGTIYQAFKGISARRRTLDG